MFHKILIMEMILYLYLLPFTSFLIIFVDNEHHYFVNKIILLFSYFTIMTSPVFVNFPTYIIFLYPSVPGIFMLP